MSGRALGPNVVAIGGGHGLAASLRAIRRYAGTTTAIVSVADDGGSSGRLRELLGIPAPGDIRRCIGALLPEGSVLGKALEHRFADGDLDGHALGNLLIAALAAATGDFAAGVAEACRVLGAEGSVLPATTVPVELRAEIDGHEMRGQAAIHSTGHIVGVKLVPAGAAPPPEALAALARADQIVIGPGSLYTSVLAACAVPAVRCAVEAAGERGAQRVYVCNLREEHPETSGYDVARHLEALHAHGVHPDVALADSSAMPLGEIALGRARARIVQADLAGPNLLVHSPQLLGEALASLAGLPGRVAGGDRSQHRTGIGARLQA